MARIEIAELDSSEASSLVGGSLALLRANLRGVKSVMIAGGVDHLNAVTVLKRRIVLSDLDFVVVTANSGFIGNLTKASSLEHLLSTNAGMPVTVAIIPIAVLHRAPRRLYYYELTEAPVIAGEDLRAGIRVKSRADLESQEQVTVTINYLFHLMSAYQDLLSYNGDPLAAVRIEYALRKSVLGALKGLALSHRYASDLHATADTMFRQLTDALGDLREGGELVRAPEWDRLAQIVGGSLDLSPSSGELAAAWFSAKDAILAILEIVRNDQRVRRTNEASSSRREDALRRIVQNVQFFVLGAASGSRPRLGALSPRRHVRAEAQSALMRLASSIELSSVDAVGIAEVWASLSTLILRPTLHANHSPTAEAAMEILSCLWRSASPALGY